MINEIVSPLAQMLEEIEIKASDVLTEKLFQTLLQKQGLSFRTFNGKFGRDASGYKDFSALVSKFPAPSPALRRFLLNELEGETEVKLLKVYHDAIVGLNHKISGSVKYIKDLLAIFKKYPKAAETKGAKEEVARIKQSIILPALEWASLFETLLLKVNDASLLAEFEDETFEEHTPEDTSIIEDLVGSSSPIEHYNKKHLPNLKQSFEKLESLVASSLPITALKIQLSQLLG